MLKWLKMSIKVLAEKDVNTYRIQIWDKGSGLKHMSTVSRSATFMTEEGSTLVYYPVSSCYRVTTLPVVAQ